MRGVGEICVDGGVEVALKWNDGVGESGNGVAVSR
jgi:hypothetical protein